MHYSISCKKSVVFTFLICLNGILLAQPIGYYNGTENLSGEQLKSALHEIINDQIDFSYNRAKDIINYSDADPNNPSNVILFYTQESRNKSQYGTGGDYINREHVWAKSHGYFEDIRAMNGDALNLRPADASVNEDRGNKDFDNVQPNGTQHPEATECWYSSSSWEPGPATKGQVARILFYMATRYEGDSNDIDLEVVDKINTFPLPEFGKLSTLIEWNNAYPPSDFERRRNERIYQIQQNRNPFVDNPEFVNLIWNNKEIKKLQFSGLKMNPKIPNPGETVTISASVISEAEPDGVILFWGKSFNSRENQKQLISSAGEYSTEAIFENIQSGEMVYFTLKAYSLNDSCISHGSYLFPEVIPVNEITKIEDVQGNGFSSPMLNQTVTITGRVTANFDYAFYIQDATGIRSGVNIYSLLQTGNVGDSVVIRGKVAEYNSLTEITDVDYFYNFRNNTEIKPITITCSQIGEDYEGMLVKIENITFANGGQQIKEENATYSFSDETGQSVVYSSYDTRIVGKSLPVGKSTLVGIVSQYNNGYQILPRDVDDINVYTNTEDIQLAKNSLNIYPNPAKSTIYISGATNIVSIEIYSANGELLYRKASKDNKVNISAFSPGIYFMKVETEKNNFAYTKFIKH
ncbi:MAG: endonuclease [Draconibacterium sp.]